MIPSALQKLAQWVGWKYGKARADGKRPKIPINPHTGKEAKSNDPATWGSYATATAAVERFALEGVGFMFADGGGLAGVDFDDCIVNGELVPEAAAVVKMLNSYAEISPSLSGVKVWVKGTKPAGAACVKAGALGCARVEVYDNGRFFTVTGRHLPGMPTTVEDRQPELEELCRRLWPKRVGTVGKIYTPSPKESQRGGSSAAERCRKYLDTLPKAISGNSGSDVTLTAACVCYRFGLSDDEAAEEMEWFNTEKCEPQWTREELAHKLEDAREKVEAAGELGKMLDNPSKRPWHNDLPAWIRNLKRPRLRPYQTAILQAIANRCNAKPIDASGSLGGAFIGYDTLAETTGMCRKTAFNHVKKLVGMGLLVKVEKGGIDYETGAVLANSYAIPGAEGVKIGRSVKRTPQQHWITKGCKNYQPSGVVKL